MRQFYSEDDLHPMGRALDPNALPAAAPAGGPMVRAAAAKNGSAALEAEPAQAVRHVCPFCGALNELPHGPCPRCTMENTSQTRKATKARIGPWYVLQNRNPAAPGMKFETLLGFVRRRRVKPGSIVRGPTTHQLWRYASQVKGLSREFGLCYSCGGAVAKDAGICPRCNRLQDPPANPDVLLESEAELPRPAAAPVYKELKPAAPVAEADIVVPALGPLPAGGVVGADVFGDIPDEDGPPDAPAAAGGGSAPVRSATDLADEEDAQRPFSVNDLAAAFRMSAPPADGGGGDYGGGGYGGGYGGGGFGSGGPIDVPAIFGGGGGFYPRRSIGRSVVVLAAVVLVGLGVWLMFDDISRRRTLNWFQEAYAAVRRTGEDASIGGHRKETTPEAGSPVNNRPLLPDTTATTQDPAPPDDLLVGDSELMPDSQPLIDDIPEEPEIVPDLRTTEAAPATAETPLPDEEEFPRTEPENPVERPPAPDPQESIEHAKTLKSAALDAMALRDYEEALRLLDDIRLLPEESWPTDLEVLTDRIKFLMARERSQQ